jgi:hypothetical protein
MKYDQDPQGGILQQVVLGDGSQQGASEHAVSSKVSQRTKDKEQRHRLAKINSAGNNADFLRRNLTMLKISSYVVFGTIYCSLAVHHTICAVSNPLPILRFFIFLILQRFSTLSSPTWYSSELKRRLCCPSRIKSTGHRIALCRCV